MFSTLDSRALEAINVKHCIPRGEHYLHRMRFSLFGNFGVFVSIISSVKNCYVLLHSACLRTHTFRPAMIPALPVIFPEALE